MTATESTGVDGAGLRPGWRYRTIDAVDERLGLKALQYPVPEHANNLGWSLGGPTVVVFFVLIGTGIVMTQHYDPSPEAANASVRNLATGVLGPIAKLVAATYRALVVKDDVQRGERAATRAPTWEDGAVDGVDDLFAQKTAWLTRVVVATGSGRSRDGLVGALCGGGRFEWR